MGILSSVCPTGVGMNRIYHLHSPDAGSMPHRRGDEPNKDLFRTILFTYAPQAWG